MLMQRTLNASVNKAMGTLHANANKAMGKLNANAIDLTTYFIFYKLHFNKIALDKRLLS